MYLRSSYNTPQKSQMFRPIRSIALTLVKQLIRRKFPTVRQMSTAEFAQILANDQSTRSLILDSRSEAEYAVSHIAEAHRVEGDLSIVPVLSGIPKSTPIIVYCSVGYRSSRVVQKLMEEGFQNVSNLEGGIFQWYNEGRWNEQVHPYNAVWGMLLNRGRMRNVSYRRSA
jgi:rhodanese-related sulfurtransferase